jgi:hypothetical protein
MGGCLKVIVVGFLAIIVFAVIGGLSRNSSGDDDYSSAATPSISQKGFFQDDRRNRVFTLEMPPGMTAAQAQAHAQSLPYTQGQVTGAYFYRPGSQMPIDGVTLARNFLVATEVLDTPGLSRYAYAYVRGFNGNATFADCEANPKDDLCASTR